MSERGVQQCDAENQGNYVSSDEHIQLKMILYTKGSTETLVE